jgi:hypothetical protein
MLYSTVLSRLSVVPWERNLHEFCMHFPCLRNYHLWKLCLVSHGTVVEQFSYYNYKIKELLNCKFW